MKLTPARVILQIVYSEDEVSQDLIDYKNELEGYGVLVKLVKALDMKCVLKAQIVRLLAYLLPEVSKSKQFVINGLNFYNSILSCKLDF